MDRIASPAGPTEKAGKFAPGASWAYSNSGYVVLGLIVAQKGAEPFGDFLHRRIFEPLRMKHTLAFVNGQNSVSGRAYGEGRQIRARRELGVQQFGVRGAGADCRAEGRG